MSERADWSVLTDTERDDEPAKWRLVVEPLSKRAHNIYYVSATRRESDDLLRDLSEYLGGPHFGTRASVTRCPPWSLSAGRWLGAERSGTQWQRVGCPMHPECGQSGRRKIERHNTPWRESSRSSSLPTLGSSRTRKRESGFA